MKVNSEQAIKSVIASKQQRRNQLQHEQKLIFGMGKDKKDDTRREQEIMKFYGLKVNKKDFAVSIAKGEELFQKTLKEFRKIKTNKPNNKKSRVPMPAWPHHDGAPDHGPHFPEPMPAPNEDGRITEAVCFFPAANCEGANCDKFKATIFPDFKSEGVGGPLGYRASAVPADLSDSLYYLYIPPMDGNITVLAEIFLTGEIITSTIQQNVLDAITAHAARAMADAKMSLKVIVWQAQTILQTGEQVVADLHVDNHSWDGRKFHDDLFIMDIRSWVARDTPVIIEVRAQVNLTGRSDYATAHVNFGKGQRFGNFDFGIRVPQLCVFFDHTPGEPIL